MRVTPLSVTTTSGNVCRISHMPSEGCTTLLIDQNISSSREILIENLRHNTFLQKGSSCVPSRSLLSGLELNFLTWPSLWCTCLVFCMLVCGLSISSCISTVVPGFWCTSVASTNRMESDWSPWGAFVQLLPDVDSIINMSIYIDKLQLSKNLSKQKPWVDQSTQG